MEHWARRGIAARAVLFDVPRVLGRDGAELDPFDHFPIDAPLLERVAQEQGVEIRPADILMVRTGWVEAYSELPALKREVMAEAGKPGSQGPPSRASCGTTASRR